MERDKLRFQGKDFKQGDMLVFNEQIIGHAVSFNFAEDMKQWAVKLDEDANSCNMERIRFADDKEKKTFLAFTKIENDDFKTVSVRYTAFF
jgi:hypothetical protein